MRTSWSWWGSAPQPSGARGSTGCPGLQLCKIMRNVHIIFKKAFFRTWDNRGDEDDGEDGGLHLWKLLYCSRVEGGGGGGESSCCNSKRKANGESSTLLGGENGWGGGAFACTLKHRILFSCSCDMCCCLTTNNPASTCLSTST